MVQKNKVREITLVDDKGTFSTFFRKWYGEEPDFDYDALATLRHIFSNEKARMLHTIKTKNPTSIYALAKLLKRNFKSVFDDVKLLERFGFIDLVAEKSGKRSRLKPILAVETLRIDIKL